MDFRSAVQEDQNRVFTENGMTALATTSNYVLDLFYAIGASRGKNIIPLFENAVKEDADLAVRVALWARDVRGGAGERQLFRDILQYLEATNGDLLLRVLPKVAELGRWDDLLVIQSPQNFAIVADMIRNQIVDEYQKFGSSLASKWMPRKSPDAIRLRNAWNMTPKQYRKFLVNTSKVVETQMCRKEFSEIDFQKVPSLAMARYSKAFARRTPETFQAYKDALSSGEAKVNAGAIYPYDVLKTMKGGETQLANEQWKALPNFLGNDFVLPMIDVSGSMEQPTAGSATAMDIAISLGLYLADRQTGPFGKMSMSFSRSPKFQDYSGCKSLHEMYRLVKQDVGYNTNIQAAFEKLLETAIRNRVPAHEMPKYLLILSDMEFDEADSTFGKQTMFELVSKLYTNSGYQLPTIVFWNLVSRNQHVPVKKDQNGTVMISGFSPAIMKSVLAVDHDRINPINIMLDTIMNTRYDF